MTDDQYKELIETLYDTRSDIKAIQTDLAYHIRRTDILEGRFESLDKDVTKLRGFFTIAGWIVASIATVLTILNQLKII